MPSALSECATRLMNEERLGRRFIRAIGTVGAGTVALAAVVVTAPPPGPHLPPRPPSVTAPRTTATTRPPPSTALPPATRPPGTAGPTTTTAGPTATTAGETRPEQASNQDQPVALPTATAPAPESVPPTSQPPETTSTTAAVASTTTTPPRNKAHGLTHADDIRICYTIVDGGTKIQRPCPR